MNFGSLFMEDILTKKQLNFRIANQIRGLSNQKFRI
jgi:hypothetical protein